MNKKAKLASAVLGFAGLNGTGLALVKNGLGTGSSFNAGGAFSSLFSSRSITSPSKKLDVRGDNPDSLDLELREKVTEVGLNTTEPDGLGISTEKIDSNKSTSSVLSILKEVTREGEVTKIHNDTEEHYRRAIQGKNLSEKYSELSSAIDKVKKWDEQKDTIPAPRSKRSVSVAPAVPILSQEERVTLRTFFDVYSYLNSTRPHLNNRLQSANEGSDVLLQAMPRDTQAEMPSIQDIQTALNWIWWNRDKTKIKVEHRTVSGLLAHPRPYKENSYGWGSWQRNPFRHFFKDQDEFQRAMDKLDGAQEALEAYLSGKRAEGLFASILGPGMVAKVYKDKAKFESALGDTQSSVELQVGKKLIEWMGR